jgi:Uncharacterized Fe-S protein
VPAPALSDPQPEVDLRARIRALALTCGFVDAGIVHQDFAQDREHLDAWLARGFHGSMAYMARDPALRSEPARLRPGTLSVISVVMPCLAESVERANAVLAQRDQAYIARYALGRDYHRPLRARLLRLGRRIAEEIVPHGYRVLADSAPALEKAMARNAGLGSIGKHTLLLRRRGGSFFLLGEIYTDLPLPTDPPQARDLCGACSACRTVCPTEAIIAPYQLDARRCISYLTIENRDGIPRELRAAIGNRIFGCDDCQLVCPWNRYATVCTDADFAPRHGLDRARLLDLFDWDEATWLARTEGMALRRATWRGWRRNLAVALGNAPPSQEIITALAACADEPDAMLREHYHWALERQISRRDNPTAT